MAVRRHHPSILGRTLGAPTVEADRPRFDAVHSKVRLAPRITREHGTHGVLRFGLDDEHHAMLVGEWSAQHDDTRLHELVHKGCVGGPVGLLLHGA